MRWSPIILAFIALGAALAIPVVPKDPAPGPIAVGCRAHVNQTACSEDKCCNWSARDPCSPETNCRSCTLGVSASCLHSAIVPVQGLYTDISGIRYVKSATLTQRSAGTVTVQEHGCRRLLTLTEAWLYLQVRTERSSARVCRLVHARAARPDGPRLRQAAAVVCRPHIQ
jgi:hypothetical protein